MIPAFSEEVFLDNIQGVGIGSWAAYFDINLNGEDEMKLIVIERTKKGDGQKELTSPD